MKTLGEVWPLVTRVVALRQDHPAWSVQDVARALVEQVDCPLPLAITWVESIMRLLRQPFLGSEEEIGMRLPQPDSGVVSQRRADLPDTWHACPDKQTGRYESFIMMARPELSYKYVTEFEEATTRLVLVLECYPQEVYFESFAGHDYHRVWVRRGMDRVGRGLRMGRVSQWVSASSAMFPDLSQ